MKGYLFIVDKEEKYEMTATDDVQDVARSFPISRGR
jgi:hypothetical protein